jgi:predicted phage-related endonuclease
MKRGLSAEQIIARRDGIGGSDVAKLINGEWLDLWMQKTGRAEPEDLTWVLPVQIGIVTEELNLEFFEHATGHQVFGRGERYRHPDHDFITATLDGMALINDKPAIVQAKHVSAFAKIEEVEQRYFGQVSHEMLVTGASVAFLSVFLGTMKHEIVEVRRDREYTNRLLDLEVEFWNYVLRDEQPPDKEGLAAPAKPETFRTIDMTGQNLWASLADAWLTNNPAAKACDKAAKELRALIDPDVGLAFGHGIEIKRAKDGKALYLREMK